VKKKIKILVVAAISLSAVLIIAAALLSLPTLLIHKAVDSTMEKKGLEWFSDGGIHVFLAGTGTPQSVKGRANACIVVIAANQFFMVDAGAGSWKNISLEQLPLDKLSGILLTHYHSDHITDVGEAGIQSWISGRSDGPLPVYGPEGVGQVVAGFNTLYALDRSYRTALHGEDSLPSESGMLTPIPFYCDEDTGSIVVFEKNGLKITAFLVDHRPAEPACGFRFDFNQKSVVISGDTRKCDNILQYSKGADLLIHEVAAKNLSGLIADYLKRIGFQREGEMVLRVLDFHTSVQEAAEIAEKADVKKMVFTHIAPSLSPAIPQFVLKNLFLKGLDISYKGPIVFGTDGMWFHVY
jgi:ribonuclease Z